MRTQTKQTLRIYWQHAKKYRKHVFWVTFFLLAATTYETAVPILYKNLVDTLVAHGDALKIVFYILILNIVGWFFWRGFSFVFNFAQSRTMADLADTCFKYLTGHSYSFFNDNFSGALVRKVNRYSRSFEEFTDQLYLSIAPAILRLVFIIAIMFVHRPLIGMIIFGWSIVYLLYSYVTARYKFKYDVIRAEADTALSGYLADTITNNINLKLFSGTTQEFKNFKKLSDNWFLAMYKSWNMGSVIEAISAAFLILLEFLVIYAGIILYRKGSMSVGDFVLVQTYAFSIFGYLFQMTRFIRRTYESFADAEEMTEILLARHAIQDKPGARDIVIENGKIEFKNVYFSYKIKTEEAGTDVLSDFNLIIKPGQRVALIGPSGGGKSTIVKLLFRFFDVQSGEILIDAQNIADVTQESLRACISLVPQDPILFHRSLMENIRYARPSATNEEVIAAAKLAHCHEFISSFKEGYETLVGERGVKLSGGERQRVAIARAILKNAPILVLDEATSSLDSESEKFIQDSLKHLMKGKTTIVIAHRLSTIMQMDRIIVLEKGKIREEGQHEELLKVNQGLYQKLWEIQAGGFEKSGS